jgi:glycosyltransferase involved in cell wall biosynthesis
MRILHCLDTIDPSFGGPVEAARQFARFRCPGTDVEVLTLDDDASRWSDSWPVPIHAIGQGYSTYRYNPALVKWLKARHAEYDAVIVHGLFRYNLVGAWQALRSTPCPYYVFSHGMLNPWFKKRYPLNHLRKALFWHWRIKHAMAGAAGIIYLTKEERRLANETFDITPFRTVYHPLGIEDPSKVATEANPAFLQNSQIAGKRMLLFFGRICEVKACDLLVRAFASAKLPNDVVLVFAGPDNEGIQSRLQQLSQQIGVADRIVWLGPIYGPAKFSLLRRAELFVLPSHCEAFPVAALEAMASGVPVLVSDKVNLSKAFEEAGAGLVCSNDPQSLATQLSFWCQLDPAPKSRMGQNARLCFEKHFRIENAVRLHEEMVASGRSTGRPENVRSEHPHSAQHELIHE